MVSSGTAGASARREYERRRAADEARIRARWGRLGGVAVALTDERQSTRAWDVGAAGEQRVGAALEPLAALGIGVLHDRRIRGTRANIDHLVVTSDGVWVIDAKHYRGRPERRIDGGIFRPRVERLVVGGREQTKLVEGVLGQVGLVRAALARDALDDVPVFGALCFVGADWPLFGGSFTVRGVDVLWPGRLVGRISSAPAGAHDVPTLVARLTGAFPSA